VSSTPSLYLVSLILGYHRLVNRIYPLAKKNWGPKNFDLYRRMTLEIFTNRRAHSKEALSSRLAHIPVTLVHGLGDVAYPLTYSEEFMQQLEDAGVQVSLVKIPDAPHFVNIESHTEFPE